MMVKRQSHAIVVGAGFAGLAAARKLQAAAPDVKVTVLEASGRVGGRAHTVEVRGILRTAAITQRCILCSM